MTPREAFEIVSGSPGPYAEWSRAVDVLEKLVESAEARLAASVTGNQDPHARLQMADVAAWRSFVEACK